MSSPAGVMPPKVKLAQTLVYVWVAIAVLNTIITLVAQDSLVDAYLDDRGVPDSMRSFAADGAPAYVAISLISLIVIGGLLVWCAMNFPKRKNWARIVTWVFAGLSVLGMVLSFVQPSPFWYKLIGIISGLVALAIIILLANAEANAWFARQEYIPDTAYPDVPGQP